MKITIKVEEQGKRCRWKAIKVWEYENKKHGIYRVNEGKEYKAPRLEGLERVGGGEKVIIREREKRRKIDLFKRTLKVMLHIFNITRAYESCLACQTLTSNWNDRCFGQHSWNSVQSVSQDTIHGFQQIRCRGTSKLTRPLRPCLIQTEVTFQVHRTWRSFLVTV